jgi:hypothetical protein
MMSLCLRDSVVKTGRQLFVKCPARSDSEEAVPDRMPLGTKFLHHRDTESQRTAHYDSVSPCLCGKTRRQLFVKCPELLRF